MTEEEVDALAREQGRRWAERSEVDGFTPTHGRAATCAELASGTPLFGYPVADGPTVERFRRGFVRAFLARAVEL